MTCRTTSLGCMRHTILAHDKLLYNPDLSLSEHLSPVKLSSQSRNLNSTFSASYIKITITFDVLDRFQENRVLQTAQIMKNIPRSSKIW